MLKHIKRYMRMELDLSTTSEQKEARLPRNDNELEAYLVAALRKYRNE
jgi:nanoRNase/pAp phosphatase (c-di-AMP/oligoRNAs hydrolase)